MPAPASVLKEPAQRDGESAGAGSMGQEERLVEGSAARTDAGPTERVRAIQVHNSYLVVETDEGMMLVDQHALHERILYERLRLRVAGQGVEVQELLVPEPIDLTPMQVALLLEQREVLGQVGLGIEEFGDRCVLLQRHPALLGRMTPAELVRGIASHLEETGQVPTRGELLQDLLHMMACKAAVKAGDPLTPEEIESLVRQRHLVDDSHHCPHGRPTVLRITLNDLEREFQRK
jgi:DNA mismatch repair protein MutL